MFGCIGLSATLILLSILHKVLLLLLFCAHMVTAASKSNLSKLGPSDDRRISRSRFVFLRRFLELVLILFVVENPLSQLSGDSK